MKDESIEDLKKRIQNLENDNKRLERQAIQEHQIIRLLIAAELVTQEKVDLARELADL